MNYEGRFSRWDEEFEEPVIGWANEVEWEWGPDAQIYGVGDETATGWAMETKFHKSQFEDPDGGGPIEIGDRVGFNIGMDDDDGADLEIQIGGPTVLVHSNSTSSHSKMARRLPTILPMISTISSMQPVGLPMGYG